jgi:hypothetical protein
MKMAEPKQKFRIKMITGWTGKVDGKERHVKAGEQVDVDAATCQALVYQHLKAELVSVGEIEAKAKEKKTGTEKTRASRKAPTGPKKDKMQKRSTQKQGE